MTQILAQQSAIAEISQHALGERRLDVLLADTCAMVARILGTELVSVLQLSADGRSLKVVAGVGWRPGVVGQFTVPAAGGSMAGFTLATGLAVIVEDLGSERRFDVAPMLIEHGAVSGIGVRIGEPNDPFGTLNGFTGRRGRFTRDDVRFLEAVAGVIASAIGRLRAEDELRNSRDELAAILSSVSEGITVQDRTGRLLFANDMAGILSGFSSGDEMLAAAAPDILARFELFDELGHVLPASDLPGRVAMATGKAPPPRLVGFRIKATGVQRWSHVQASPIIREDGQATHVVSIFRDVTADKAAELSQAMVADALQALGSTLDPDEAARRLVDVCVPRLADFAEVDLVDSDGGLTLAAIAHVDPEGLESAQIYREARQPALDSRGGPGLVVREGKSVLLQLTPEALAAMGGSEDRQRELGNLDPGSYMCVPLVARGSPIGALTLIASTARRAFSAADLRLAEELGGRAAVALENAQLYRAANERTAELDAVLASMAEAVLVFDARHRLRLSNRAAVGLLGEVPQTLDVFRERLIAESSGEAPPRDGLEGEYQLAGTGRWLEVRAYSTVDTGTATAGGRSSLVVVVRDVSESRLAQTTREAFLGVMSHELRTPITTIYGGSELLAHDLDDERRAEVIRDIRAESGRLVRLVEDLLVMTRVERGVLEMADEPLLLQHVVPAAVNTLAPHWPQLEVELEIDERLPAVRGDVTYIEQVLRNLVINAIRYGDALASGITVKVDALDNEVAVRVQDRGEGLRGAEPEQLFELFFRAPAARAVSGGAGIGLFVCRALVEAMGGRAWASERDGGGAEFGFALLTIEAD